VKIALGELLQSWLTGGYVCVSRAAQAGTGDIGVFGGDAAVVGGRRFHRREWLVAVAQYLCHRD
jgi:hypothetical protein